MAEESLFTCGLDAALAVVGGKWKPLILWALHERPQRFAELRRLIGTISEKVLTQQLRQLEADGIAHREIYPQIPPKVEYSLTPLGKSLNEALLPLGRWGEENMAAIVAACRTRSRPAAS